MTKVIQKNAPGRVPNPRPTDTERRLRLEVARLRAKLLDADETLRAIRDGEVDALVIRGRTGEQVFTLKGAESSYRLLVETMSEGAATFGEDGTILYCNSYFANMVDRPIERVMGASIHEFIAPQHAEMFRLLVREGRECVAWTHGGKTEITFASTHARSVPAYVSLSPLFVDGGSSVLCLVATDLSAQKRNEEMLSSERLATSVIEQATDAMLVCDEHGRIIKASKGVLGFSKQNPLFSQFRDAFPSEALQSVVSVALRGEWLRGVAACLESDGGGWVEVLASGAPLLGTHGNIVGAIVTITDVTDLKQAQRTLESAVTLREEFLSIASHELRTPLTSLLLQLSSLQLSIEKDGGGPAASQWRMKADMAMSQARRLTKLVDALLDISRLRTGRFKLEPEECDLTTVTRGVVDAWSEEATRVGCALRFHESSPTVGFWDRMRIEQALVNLISNATKFGPGKPIDITVESTTDNVWITIEDRGRGIDAKDKDRIFRIFERAVPNQHYGGLGLGLFITSQIVEASGGSIDVTSAASEA